MLSFTRLRALRVYLSDYDNEWFFRRPVRQSHCYLHMGQTRSADAVILEVLCRKLQSLHRVEITANVTRSPAAFSIYGFAGPWTQVEQLVEEMRGILQVRDPKAVVRLYERISCRRERRDAFEDGDLIQVEMRECVRRGEYITLISPS